MDVRILLGKRSQIRIVVPQSHAGRSNIGEKLVGIAAVQITDRGGKHDDIAGR